MESGSADRMYRACQRPTHYRNEGRFRKDAIAMPFDLFDVDWTDTGLGLCLLLAGVVVVTWLIIGTLKFIDTVEA